MANPLRRLKFLPWRSLFLLSGLVTLIVIVFEFLVVVGASASPAIGRSRSFLYAGPLGIVVSLAIAVGVGALAVYLLERFFRQVIINTATLWALALCLLLCLWVKLLLPLPPILVNLNEIQLVGMILGVFWKGRPYWR